jgi:uncharacterized protein (TIGR02145 family)
MKKAIYLALIYFGMINSIMPVYSQVGVGTTLPHESAILEIQSDNQGFLVPRMTTVQRDQIVDPAEGLMFYNITESCIQIFKGNAITPSWDCIGIGNVPLSVACLNDNISGGYNLNTTLNNSHFYQILLKNESVGPKHLFFGINDITLSGQSVGINVDEVNISDTILAPGDSILVIYNLIGTPTTEGAFSIDWASNGYNCISSSTISNGNAVFSNVQTKYIASINVPSESVDFQGQITNGLPIKIAYTNGTGTYGSHTGSYVQTRTGMGENGDINNIRLKYPSGTFSSNSYIEAQLEVDGDGIFDIVKQGFNTNDTIAVLDLIFNGEDKGDLVLMATGGIPDRKFGSEHDFIYIPVEAMDGRTWLSNNLGAQYTNVNHSAFNPNAQATSPKDFNAYGSYYQHGRGSDGHELATFTDSITGSRKYGTRTTVLTTVALANNEFVKLSIDWLSVHTVGHFQRWRTPHYLLNPCPDGYLPPSTSEFETMYTAENITSPESAAKSSLAFSAGGYESKYLSNTEPLLVGEKGFYWASTWHSSIKFVHFFFFNYTYAAVPYTTRTYGYNVRCIKE